MNVTDYIAFLISAGYSEDEAYKRAIEAGLLCCGAYCSEAGCCVKEKYGR
jgi:hypothetical protein